MITGLFAANNDVLDEWEIPFGAWIEQMVRWIDQNMDGVLTVIEWPFTFLFRNFVNGPGDHPWWEVTDMPWWAVVLITFVIGSLARNAKVGAGTALALAGCGLLGTEYWDETSVTLGMILVSVVLCALIGIPLGIACGRVDAVWGTVRPALDAMQVIHSFVYMLPVIFFFGIGPEPATMVTMVFAIPPLVRLTNLGVRQVPEDVVEASRAYGAPEWRVLLDVQLPLARPAIMTGLNQTLLLSISMLGIAAIMGAGGLGLLVFRGMQNLDVALSASAGLALFLVAVVLDRISQVEASDGANLFSRIRHAWAHRRDPEELLSVADERPDAADAPAPQGQYTPAGGAERMGAQIALVGGLIAFISVFLTWGSDAGKISGYARRTDELELGGQSFNGLAASGGSWYGYIALALGLFVVACAVVTLTRPGHIGRWFGADGALIASVGMTLAVLSYLWASPSYLVPDYSDGIGVYVALLGGIVATVGSVLWIRAAPYVAHRPLNPGRSWGRAVSCGFIVGLLVIGAFSGWTFDERSDVVITDEVQAQLDRLEQEARDDPSVAAERASQITSLLATVQKKDVVILDGFNDQGAGLGPLTILIGVVGAVLVLPASGFMGDDERRKWIWSVLVAGLGTGLMLVAIAWIATLLRVADAKLVSGAGAFLTMVAGFFMLASSRNVVGEFHRSKVYAGDSDTIDLGSPASVAGELTVEPAGMV
ncbi:MAG: ABC transporter permease subunit [Actinomycetia bacterium]|nr:ABC transporter permease subunit [Actinomycetes bacterium]